MNEFVTGKPAAGRTTGPRAMAGRERNMTAGEAAAEFEKMLARQLIDQMTRQMFEPESSKGQRMPGGSMVRETVVDALSAELARQETFGIAEMIRRQRNLLPEHQTTGQGESDS